MIYLPCELTHVDKDKTLRTRDTREITQGVNQNKSNSIKDWLSTVPLSLEYLADPLPQTTFENMSADSHTTLQSGQIPTEKTKLARGVRDPQFRCFLRKCNIFISTTDASPELVKQAKEIITSKKFFPRMDDTLAKNLEDKAWKLETKFELDLITELFIPLIPALVLVPHQSLETSKNRTWSYAVDVPFDQEIAAIFPPLPKSKPDSVFGYSETAFNLDQLMASDLLVTQSNQNYAMPDENIRFPFLDLEFKAHASGGTHFFATNQLAYAGAVAMEATLELARRVSAVASINFNEPQFFSISIDHAAAYINVHWLSQKENGAFCFHMRHLFKYILDADGLKAVDRAVKNILQCGVSERLAKICEELDMYAQRINETAALEKGNSASHSPFDK